MPILANVKIQVTPLPEDDVWFANSQAWSNYWNDVIGVIEIAPIQNDVYVPVPFNIALDPVVININGVDNVLITKDQLTSLLATISALDTSYQSLRVSMRDGGLITNAQ